MPNQTDFNNRRKGGRQILKDDRVGISVDEPPIYGNRPIVVDDLHTQTLIAAALTRFATQRASATVTLDRRRLIFTTTA